MAVIYIDTRPDVGLFSAPAADIDYQAWLVDTYKKSFAQDGGQVLSYGVAQQIHMIAQQALRGSRITAIGPDAEAAADAIANITGNAFVVEVWDGGIDA